MSVVDSELRQFFTNTINLTDTVFWGETEIIIKQNGKRVFQKEERGKRKFSRPNFSMIQFRNMILLRDGRAVSEI